MARTGPVDLIEIACFQCGKPFQVCLGDYRGHRYCPQGECRKLGYQARDRERGSKYQATDQGRRNHCGRQQKLRDRARVTHGTTGPDPTTAATLSCDACDARADQEAPNAGRAEPWLGQDLPGSVPDRQREASGRVPRCVICRRIGVVVFRISREHAEGVRVRGPGRA